MMEEECWLSDFMVVFSSNLLVERTLTFMSNKFLI